MTATATLIGDQITGNMAQVGGGLFLNNTLSKLENNQISNNNAQSNGGGISVYHGSPKLDGNTIDANQSGNLAGGLYLFYTTAALTHNRITHNTASVSGGGVVVASCSPTFDSNIFSGNTASKGGGIYLWYSASTFTNNVISDNQGSVSGSGIWVGGSYPSLLHTTIARNSGGDGSGVYITSDGMGTSSTLVITNTVLVSHSIGIRINEDNTALIEGVLWFGTPITVSQGAAVVVVQHQLTGNPAFDLDGYHLTSSSAAIHQGVGAGALNDIDGQPRPLASPDLGADEYWPPGSPKYIYLPILVK